MGPKSSTRRHRIAGHKSTKIPISPSVFTHPMDLNGLPMTVRFIFIRLKKSSASEQSGDPFSAQIIICDQISRNSCLFLFKSLRTRRMIDTLRRCPAVGMVGGSTDEAYSSDLASPFLMNIYICLNADTGY